MFSSNLPYQLLLAVSIDPAAAAAGGGGDGGGGRPPVQMGAVQGVVTDPGATDHPGRSLGPEHVFT